jgi:hypothetical protein
MASVYSKNLQVFNAKQFRESVAEASPSRLYLSYGLTTPWANDAEPTQANTSVKTEYQVWQNMVGAKAITGNDIRHVVPRYDWASGQTYMAYDDKTDSIDLYANNYNFYILTEDWNVYKCLSNNRGGLSTVKPTSVSYTAPSIETDGYIWKYMYTISPSEQLKYTTTSYMPVKTLLADDNSLQWKVQNNAIAGGIEFIKVENIGSGYKSNNTISLTIKGDGTGANAYAFVNTTSNTISSVFVDNPGLGYTYADITIADSGGGSGGSVRAIVGPGGGHGADPVKELGGSYLIVNPRLSGSEGGVLSIANDYRQIALIEDPKFYGSTTTESNSVVSQLTVLTLSGTGVNYQQNEIVYQGVDYTSFVFRGIVFEWDSANSEIKLSNVEGTPTSDVLVGSLSGASRFVSSITNPDMKPYSGQLLYIDNIVPIQRSEDQTEDFKIILKF